MNYNIEFQIAGLVVTVILNILFFTKPRKNSIQNKFFSFLLVATIFELSFDIISVITIAERDNIPFMLNEFFAKGYIIVMAVWIAFSMFYIFSNFLHDGSGKREMIFFKIGCAIVILPAIAVCICTFATPLYYANYGREIYSYGTPSTATYIYSVYCVIIAIIGATLNLRTVSLKRIVPMITFTAMEGLVAIIQFLNPTVLIIGLGTAVCITIMVLVMQDPDTERISSLEKTNRQMRDLVSKILSIPVSRDFKASSDVVIENFDNVTIANIELMNFQKLSADFGMEKVVELLRKFYLELDSLLVNYNINKIREIGQSYMLAAGLPERTENHAEEIVSYLLEVQKLTENFNDRNKTDFHLKMTAHSGSIVAGIAAKRLVYDLWGDTVTFAYLLGSDSAPDIIQVSGTVVNALRDKYTFQQRMPTEIKGYGMSICYWLVRA